MKVTIASLLSLPPGVLATLLVAYRIIRVILIAVGTMLFITWWVLALFPSLRPFAPHWLGGHVVRP